MRAFKIFLLILCTALAATAQQAAPLLDLKDAIDIALKNNYNIKLTKNSNAIAANNVTLGNAGVLPQVAGNFTSTNSIQDTKQTRSDGSVNQINGAKNSSLNYGVSLNWTIFDGFGMFANYDQLKALNALSQISSRDTIESTIANVISTYYQLVNQNQQIKALRGAIEISRTQLQYAQDKLDVGRASGLDVLNAKVNLNTDTSNLLVQVQNYKSIKIRFNQLLARDLNIDFSVVDNILVDDKLILVDIINQAQTANPSIQLSQINQRLAEINLRQVKALRYPSVGLTSGYNFTDAKTPAGFTSQQNTHGFNYGLTASINIFNGFNQSRKEANAKLQIDNANINSSKTKQNIEAQINDLYISYVSGLELMKIDLSNVSIAKQNLDISLEKYKLGNITPLEIREAQRNYINAQSMYYQAQYQAKTAEISLKEITNNINIQ
ncbi:TolC family protein [Mucilaginibacter sp. HMF5004]|uniref:TolC family protein n=1 Tax=Mucilaginibacter rivuli TaxID=2857527 RepID=UPI001C5D4ABF|nr:TolC family protein [Mucilaginibacter rivuli]MBW4891156.1 TolC family protein [Mucilaginibacter rivuli]